MKKLLVILSLMFAITSYLEASSVVVVFTSGRELEGELVSQSDSLLVIVPDNTTEQIQLRPEGVSYYLQKGGGRYISVMGQFIPDQRTQLLMDKKLSKEQAKAELMQYNASHPNEVIAKAFKTIGISAIGIGVPLFCVGTILYGVGHIQKDPSSYSDSDEYNKAVTSIARCAEAGQILMPTGAALTIIGIPLYVEGKKLMELSVQVNGAGAGLALNF